VDIEGPALQSLIRSARKQIRSRMLALRQAIPAPARARRDADLVARLASLPEVDRARSIALFSAMQHKAEIDLRELDASSRASERAVLYPRLVEQPQVTSAEASSVSGELAAASLDALVLSDAGFLEPPRTAKAAVRGEVDVIVVPALAVAATGHRLGYGAGFYDRVLPAYCPPAFTVAVAYDFQLVAELPVFEWDVACDVVVTDARTLRVGR
jgi:5-formyltetrahydrofolate cyclo-ligase